MNVHRLAILLGACIVSALAGALVVHISWMGRPCNVVIPIDMPPHPNPPQPAVYPASTYVPSVAPWTLWKDCTGDCID